jgi:hypothetical protein
MERGLAQMQGMLRDSPDLTAAVLRNLIQPVCFFDN